MARRGRPEFYYKHIITASFVKDDGSEIPFVCCPLLWFWTIAAPQPSGSCLILFDNETRHILKNWHKPPAKPMPLMYGRGRILWKVEYIG